MNLVEEAGVQELLDGVGAVDADVPTPRPARGVPDRETLDSHNRYAILYRVQDARSPEARAKRIAAYVQMLAEGETLHPRKKKRD